MCEEEEREYIRKRMFVTGECELKPLETREERVCEMRKDARKETRCDVL